MRSSMGPQLIVDILAPGLADHILDDVNDKLRLHKDQLLQLLAVLPRARAIVQHRARGVQELQHPVQLLLVDAYLERDLGGLPLKVSE